MDSDDDLSLRDDAPLWARVLWYIVRRVAGLTWAGVRVYFAIWLARLIVPEFFYARKTIELGQPEVFFIVACLLGVAFVARV